MPRRRRGPGRPALPKRLRKFRVSIALTGEQIAFLKRVAAARRVPFSRVFQEVVVDLMAADRDHTVKRELHA